MINHRYNLVIAYRRHCAIGTSSLLNLKRSFLASYNSGLLLPEIYRSLGTVAFGTIERWDKRLRDNDEDPDVLLPSYREGAATVTDEEVKLLAKHILRDSQPPIREGIRNAITEMIYLGIRPKSYRTYERYMQNWKAENFDLWVMLREGDKQLNDQVMPYLQRDYNMIEVGDILVADGHTLNFEMINPKTGKNKRMTMVLWFDFKSSMPLGFEIMPSEDVLCVASALRRAILTLGFTPRIVLMDNGRSFGAKYFTNDLRTSQLPGLFAKLGIKSEFAKPYHAQTKPIERFFGVMAELERMAPTYTGIDIAHKPAYLMRNEKLHKSVHERLLQGSAITVKDSYATFVNWFRVYSQRPHQSGFYAGKTPVEIYSESVERLQLQEDFQSRRIEQDKLDFLMLEDTQKLVGRNGVRFNKEFYWNESLYGLRQSVSIKYDIFNDSEILIYDTDGRFICKAQKQGYVHPAARILGNDENVLKLHSELERQNSMRHGTVKQYKEITGTDEYLEVQRSAFQLADVETAGGCLSERSSSSPDQSAYLPAEGGSRTPRIAAPWSDFGEDASPEDYKIQAV